MLALENCRVIVGCGSDAHYSVLSGKKHQGRTARRADEPLYRTALGGDADWSIPLYGLHSSMIPLPAEWVVPIGTVGESVRFDVKAYLIFEWVWFRSKLRPCRN